ncbi:uncharacterized protein LOC143652277 isoform X1 [Tamandua tetradactyla]|uniref:uncharacterized protein LOC143652277 isoform X1 n=1 Tax=Tamandua tetradactyla TaxID=48850 RepID=UPI004053EDA8
MRKVPPPFLIGGANSPTSSGGAGSKGEVNPCSPPPPFAGVRAQHMCEARLAPSNCPPARKSLGALGEGGQGAEKAHKDSSKTRDRIAFGSSVPGRSWLPARTLPPVGYSWSSKFVAMASRLQAILGVRPTNWQRKFLAVSTILQRGLRSGFTRLPMGSNIFYWSEREL